eukprot:gene11754-8082_t
MPAPTLMLSDAEIFSIQDSVAKNVRLDGRHLLQHRELLISGDESTAVVAQERGPAPLPSSTSSNTGKEDPAAAAAAAAGGAGESDESAAAAEGSGIASVQVRLGATQVSATAVASVFRDENLANDEEEEQGQGATETRTGRGELDISLDAVPSVVQRYSMGMLGLSAKSGGRRAQRLLLSMIALTMRYVYGARHVNVMDTTLADGVADAVAVQDEAEEVGQGGGGVEDDGRDDDDDDEKNNSNNNNNSIHGSRAAAVDSSGSLAASSLHTQTGFPAAALYIGQGFAFRIHVDVHILEGGGGNLLAAVSAAVFHVLQRLRLPHVTLHKGPQGLLAEVDRRKVFATPVSFARLSRLVVLAISPTRHYVVDPCWEEEIALPQQLHVAADPEGRVTYTRYQQLPSRRGARRLVREVFCSTQHERNEQQQQQQEEEAEAEAQGPRGDVGSSESSMAKRRRVEHNTEAVGDSAARQSPPPPPLAHQKVVLRHATATATPSGADGAALRIDHTPCASFRLGPLDFMAAVADATHVVANLQERH